MPDLRRTDCRSLATIGFALAALFALPADADRKDRAAAASRSVMFGGDTSFGESYQGVGRLMAQRGYASCLEALRPLLALSDVAVVNLETPMTLPREKPITRKEYLHWTHPRRAPRALRRAGIDVVSLANNHAMDYGQRGLERTLTALERQGIAWVGAGADRETAERPYRLVLRVGGRRVSLAIFAGFEYREDYSREYNFYAGDDRPGVGELSLARLPESIRRLRKAEPEAVIVVFPHWGQNYVWKRAAQTGIARRLIDSGADLVVGHGAHRLQEIERYSGRWILYGLGNFVFNSPGRYAERGSPPYSLVARLVFERRRDGVARWLQVYPVVSDNDVVDFRPRPTNDREFSEVVALLRERAEGEAREFVTDRDAAGLFLRLE